MLQKLLKNLLKLTPAKSLISTILLLTTLFGFLNLNSVTQTRVVAQTLVTSLTSDNSTQSTNLNGQETTHTDINQVEFDQNSNYKFGQRIEANTFKPEEIKNDICGRSLDFTLNLDSSNNSNLNSNSTPKLDQNSASTVIKVVKSKCLNSTISNTWLKLVWDNGLVGWVEVPLVQTVSNQIVNQILNLGSIQTFAQATQTKKTCKDFQFQVRDLSVLNQFPNLDLDDDSVGCEHLLKNPNNQFLTGNELLLQESIAKLDKNNDQKVSCSDFDDQVVDIEVLTIFPRLDFDKDGVGCESNTSTISNSNNIAQDFDLNLPDIEIDEKALNQNLDWSSLSTSLQTVLQKDYQYSFQADSDCNTFDLGCTLMQSLAGLGKRGLWLFHFVTGILQGAGQSIVGVLSQIWNLMTKATETVSQILQAFKAITQNPEILVKAFYGEVENLLGLDTLERAKKIGQIVGEFVPDIVVGAVTVGVGIIGLKALQALNVSQKVASSMIKVGKLVGKTLKLLGGEFEILISPIGKGVVGIRATYAKKIARILPDKEFENFIKTIKNSKDISILKEYRKLYPLGKILSVSPETIRFTQNTVNKKNLAIILDIFKKSNTYPDDMAPLIAVRMEDGILTSIDNKRLLAARLTGKQAKIIEFKASDVIPDSYKYTDYPINKDPRFNNSKTFGEAIKYRINDQKPKYFGKDNPLGSFSNPKY